MDSTVVSVVCNVNLLKFRRKELLIVDHFCRIHNRRNIIIRRKIEQLIIIKGAQLTGLFRVLFNKSSLNVPKKK